MAINIIKETIELDSVTCDGNGNAFLQKRINLQSGMIHNLLQTDIFEDAYFASDSVSVRFEAAVSPYPIIPTDMPFIQSATVYKNRYPSAGDDSVLFKVNGIVGDNTPTEFNQFPSKQIAADQKTAFKHALIWNPFIFTSVFTSWEALTRCLQISLGLLCLQCRAKKCQF